MNVDPVVAGAVGEVLQTGIIGTFLVLILLGQLRPKWDADAKDKQIAIKDEVILKQSDALQRLADRRDADQAALLTQLTERLRGPQ